MFRLFLSVILEICLFPPWGSPRSVPKATFPPAYGKKQMLMSLDLPVAETLGEVGGGGTSCTLWGERGWGPHERPACRTQSAAPAFLGAGSLAQTC